MAEVAENLLLLPQEEEEDEDDETLEEEFSFEGAPYWSVSPFHSHEIHPQSFDPTDTSDVHHCRIHSQSDSDSTLYFDDDRLALTLDLFDRASSSPHHAAAAGDLFSENMDPMGFCVFDDVAVEEEMGDSDYLELGLGLGLGLGIDKRVEEGGDGDGREVEWDEEGSGVRREGLRIVEFGSDSDSDDGGGRRQDSGGGSAMDRIGSEDLGLPLCWDCLHIDEDRRDPNEEFEWEEVDDGVDEREALNLVLDGDGVRSGREMEELDQGDGEIGEEEDVFEGDVLEPEELEGEGEEAARHIEWEVLLAVNNLERNPSIGEPEYLGGDDHDDYVYTSEYEIWFGWFGQFTDHDSAMKGSPPASKSVVEDLPSVVLTKEDVANGNTLCAVCKDEISFEESAKRLPCSHHYHGDCILPWLRIRNTCPVCRYELPTDDPDYESWRARRTSRGSRPQIEESRVRYDFELFPVE